MCVTIFKFYLYLQISVRIIIFLFIFTLFWYTKIYSYLSKNFDLNIFVTHCFSNGFKLNNFQIFLASFFRSGVVQFSAGWFHIQRYGKPEGRVKVRIIKYSAYSQTFLHIVIRHKKKSTSNLGILNNLEYYFNF